MKIDIEDLKKVKIDKDDVLIVKYKHDGSSYPLERQTKILAKTFPNNKVLFIDINNADLVLCKAYRDFDEVKTL